MSTIAMVPPWSTRDELKCIDLIGEGGFAKVYLAYSSEERRLFAVKVISVGDFIRRTVNCNSDFAAATKLRRETRALFILQGHGNIVEYIDHWMEGPLATVYTELMLHPEIPREQKDHLSQYSSSQEESYSFIRMEYCRTNLRDWMSNMNNGLSNLVETNQIILQIARALVAIHSKNIIHRDLHPGNVLVKTRSEGVDVKVCDFGLSKPTDVDMGDTSLTSPVGLNLYRSPEVLSKSKYYFKSDVYSLGLIYYELLANWQNRSQRGMREEERNRIFLKFRQGKYDNLKKVGGSKEGGICRMMLEVDVCRRYSAKQVVTNLDRVINGNRYMKLWICVALLVTLLATGLVWWWLKSTPPILQDIDPYACGPYELHLYKMFGCVGSVMEFNVTSRNRTFPALLSFVPKSAWVFSATECTGDNTDSSKGVRLWSRSKANNLTEGTQVANGIDGTTIPIRKPKPFSDLCSGHNQWVPCAKCTDFNFFLNSVTCE